MVFAAFLDSLSMAVKKPKRVLLKQSRMRRVLLALLPCMAGAVYFFGWRSLAMVLWAGAVGFAVEYIFTRHRGEPVTESVFVTTTILALIMPPTAPWHVLTIGTVFAVMFTKEIFGGFGRNFFNPAMAGRCFVYVCFPVAMTAVWSAPAEGTWGALDRWTTASAESNAQREGAEPEPLPQPPPRDVPTLSPPSVPQALTTATPMAYLKLGQVVLVSKETAGNEPAAEGERVQSTTPGFQPPLSRVPFDIPEEQIVRVDRDSFWKQLFLGRVSGTMGVTSVLLILIGGLYLFFSKTASRTIILTIVLTYALLSQILYWAGVQPVPSGVTALLGGGWLFGAFFMATDPVSAPKTELGRGLYAALIAVCSVVIRNFSIFNGGLMFSILIGNMFAPIIDYAVRAHAAAAAGKRTEKEAVV
ncbi:MAG: RnfABCDGE type electron transport complex subunit D [Solirubrobacterales bacterium]